MMITSQYWYVEKDGTVVQKCDTKGGASRTIPASCDVIKASSVEDLPDVIDPSVLTNAEAQTLSISNV